MLGVETALAVVLTTLVEPGVLHARAGAGRDCRGSRPRSPGSTRRHGGPIAAGAPAHLCVIDPAHQWVVDGARSRAARATRRGKAGSSPARSATRSTPAPHRRDASPQVTHSWTLRARAASTIDDGTQRATRRHWERARMTGALVLADGTTFEGEAVGYRPDDGVAAGEVVFNTALVGLPGDRHRPVVRGPDHHVHVPAHRELRHQRARRRGARAALPRRDRARPRAPRVELARDRRPRRLPAPPQGRRPSPASTPAG